jgi:prolipoprotein diacylglyceryltransferase
MMVLSLEDLIKIGILLAVSIFSLVFWILMLVDCAKRKFKESSEQIVWILVIVLAGIIGALIYYFIVKKKK